MDAPVFPPMFRTVCYALGVVLGIGVNGVLLAMSLPALAAAAGALGSAAGALAFGYRPTRAPEGWTGPPQG